jgi:hypothetical protein
MTTPNPHASALGRLAAGKPKHYSAAEIARRTARLADARIKRNAERMLARAIGFPPVK